MAGKGRRTFRWSGGFGWRRMLCSVGIRWKFPVSGAWGYSDTGHVVEGWLFAQRPLFADSCARRRVTASPRHYYLR